MKQNMIKRAILVASFGLLAVGAMAQGQQQEMEVQHVERLTRQLNLTTEQVAKLQEINLGTRAAMLNLRNDQSMDRPSKMEKMRILRSERETAIKAILTQEQGEKYEAMLQGQQNRPPQQRPQQNRRRGTR